jgi:hypothetical protein
MTSKGFGKSQINQSPKISYPKTIEGFKEKFFRTARNPAKALKQHGWIFEQISGDKPITEQLLNSLIYQTKPYSSKRHNTCSFLQELITYLGVETSIDL